jgi:hypothetical protein
MTRAQIKSLGRHDFETERIKIEIRNFRLVPRTPKDVRAFIEPIRRRSVIKPR